MNQFAAIALSAILSSNVVAVAGVGAISLQTEKRNFLYMLISSLCIIVSVIISGILVCVLNTYVLVRLQATEFRLMIIVLFSILMSFASSALLKAVSKETYFIYEKSYGFPIQTCVCIGTLLLVDYTREIMLSIFELAMFSVGFLLVQLLFYALYARLDSRSTLKPARNIPVMLYTLSILSIILFVVGTMF